jgi:UDP-N-acetyl-D-glucosamine dehydrogenase
MKSVPVNAKMLAGYDAVVISTDHSDYDYDFLYTHAKLIIDTRNALKISGGDRKVVKA